MDRFIVLPCHANLEIEYVNTERVASRRMVTVKQFVSNRPDGYIQAFCHERKMARTFKYASMLAVTNTDTGEIIKPEMLFLHLNEIYEKAPEREFDFFISSLRPIVDVLTFIAHCDGRYLPSEQKDIANWLMDISELDRDQFADYALEIIKKWPQPDQHDFMRAVNQVKKHLPEWRSSLLERAHSVARADRKLVETEEDYLKVLSVLLEPVE